MDAPETEYAQSGDLSIAYQVAGEGELDLVFVPGFISNADLSWQAPLFGRAHRRRVAALAAPGEVLVTSTVRDLVNGSGIEFTDRGAHALKGVPGEWHVLAVRG